MRINGNFFNFMNSSFFNRSSMISRLLGSRNAGSVNMPDRSRVNQYSQTYMKDGVLYHKRNQGVSKLYTREGTLEGTRRRRYPHERKTFYSGQEILDAIKKYDGYMLGYDGKTAYFQGTKNIYSNTSRYPVESRPVGEKMYFNPADVNAALGIHNPKQMSVKDNEVRFDSYSYYQFQGRDGKNHRVLSMGSSLRSYTFADFNNYTYDKEAANYADFGDRLSKNSTYGLEQDYSQKEIRSRLEEAGIQNGFFTVTVGGNSQTYFMSQNEKVGALFTKEEYDRRYNMLVSGQTFHLDKFQPGQTVTVGGKEYVLNEHKGIDIEYGAEVYLGVK